MRRRASLLLASLFLLFPVVLRGDDRWSQLKLGMTAEESVATLGRPMLRTAGRGFELWTYDNGAEVLLSGSLVGWTAPGTGTAIGRSVDVWQAHGAEPYFPNFLALVPRPAAKTTRRQAVAGTAGELGDAIWLPVYVSRRK